VTFNFVQGCKPADVVGARYLDQSTCGKDGIVFEKKRDGDIAWSCRVFECCRSAREDIFSLLRYFEGGGRGQNINWIMVVLDLRNWKLMEKQNNNSKA
jgi:hypothetical protein